MFRIGLTCVIVVAAVSGLTRVGPAVLGPTAKRPAPAVSVMPPAAPAGSAVSVTVSGLHSGEHNRIDVDGRVVHFVANSQGRYSFKYVAPKGAVHSGHTFSLGKGKAPIQRTMFKVVPDTPANEAGAAHGLFLGVAITGVPADMGLLQNFQRVVGKKMAIVSFWRSMGGLGSGLYPSWFQAIYDNGSVPMITWEPETWRGSQKRYSLWNIAHGRDDGIVRNWARQLKALGRPVLLRFGHEMNGDWSIWGQQPHAFVAAWRHIHNIFTAVGARNVEWVWCPNTQWSNPKSRIGPYYPGDRYVDWIGLDSYNQPQNGTWLSMSALLNFYSSYRDITALSSKPLMVAETASAEASRFASNVHSTKADWIRNTFRQALPSLPRVKALVWLNVKLGCCDWRIQSSRSSEEAFKQSIASPFYLTQYP